MALSSFMLESDETVNEPRPRGEGSRAARRDLVQPRSALRSYLDSPRLHHPQVAGAFFPALIKSNTCKYVVESRPVAKIAGLRREHTIQLNSA